MAFQPYITTHPVNHWSGCGVGVLWLEALSEPQRMGKVQVSKGRKHVSRRGGGRDAGHSGVQTIHSK